MNKMKLFNLLCILLLVEAIFFLVQVYHVSIFQFLILTWSKIDRKMKAFTLFNKKSNLLISNQSEINYYCNRTYKNQNDEIEKYMNLSYKQVDKYFENCTLKKYENFLEQREITSRELLFPQSIANQQIKLLKYKIDKHQNNLELYALKLDFDGLKKKLNLTEEKKLRCLMTMAKKANNKPEDNIKLGKTLAFTKHFNYEILLKDFGICYINCFISTKHKPKSVWRNVFNIIPRNMSKYIEKNNPNLKKIDLIKSKFTDDPKNPLLRDSHFTECGNDSEFTNPEKKINLFILAFDSVSHQHFKRIFPSTFEYLNQNMSHNTIFENFNKIGENTYPNMVPLMTGALMEKISEQKIKADLDYYVDLDTTYHDNFPFIWREYEKLGYFTMYNEEHPRFNTYCYRKKGFRYSPTSYYGFPYYFVYSRIITGLMWCLNNRLAYEDSLENLERIISRFDDNINKDLPYFSFNFLKFYTHDYFTMPSGFDKRLREFVELYDKKYSQNSMFIVMSDHGSRLSSYSYNSEEGKIERSLPFLSIKLPETLVNTTFGINLRKNKKKLVTVLDMYKTMKQFYYLNRYGINSTKINSEKCRAEFQQDSKHVRQKRGISLFEELPTNRSCQDALISNTYCTCVLRKRIDENIFYQETKNYYNQTSLLIVNYINKLTDNVRSQCAVFTYKSVKTVKRAFYMSYIVYEFSVFLKPHSLFQGSIKLEDGNPTLFDKIIRLDKYGKQSNCMKEQKYYGFCYCLNI